MPSRSDQIRNIALAGHPGSGKTTLFEALLHAGGVIASVGSIERGSTVSDFDPMEHAAGHSLNSAIASLCCGDTQVNLIDTARKSDVMGQGVSVRVDLGGRRIITKKKNIKQHYFDLRTEKQ